MGHKPFSLPFLLKLAAATLAGAAALLAFQKVHRHEILSSQRRELRDALLLRGGAVAPPAVLVAGFQSHGKSSFVNTACRVLAGETGSLLLRAETAPPGPTSATLARHAFRAEVSEEGEEEEEEEEVAVDLVDAPPLPEAGKMTKADVEAALREAPAPECVVLVLRCSGSVKERHMAVKNLTDIACVVRQRGLNLVVVLTHKRALKTIKQVEDLRREVAFRARTDCVYFMENYTASGTSNIHHPLSIENDYDTQLTMLSIIRQCVEFSLLYRNRSSAKSNAVDEVLLVKKE